MVFGLLVITFIGIQFWKQENATCPPRIISQRSVASGFFFVFSLGGAFFTIVYYLPIWFQAIQGVSAVESGIRNLPMILGVVVMSIVSGVGITTLGYFTPFIILSSILMSIGAGLLSTFRVNTGSGEWIGYQIIAGCGVGLGIQTPIIAIQTVLPLQDVPVGTSIVRKCTSVAFLFFAHSLLTWSSFCTDTRGRNLRLRGAEHFYQQTTLWNHRHSPKHRSCISLGDRCNQLADYCSAERSFRCVIGIQRSHRSGFLYCSGNGNAQYCWGSGYRVEERQRQESRYDGRCVK